MQRIREGGDEGVPVMMSDDPITRAAFEDFAAQVVSLRGDAQCPDEGRRVAGTVAK